MARDYFINGETLVRVKGGQHWSGGAIAQLSELGLASDFIRVQPRWLHRDVRCDDFGPNIPAEVMWNLADVMVSMTLVHYDREVLEICMAEAGGGATGFSEPVFSVLEGHLTPAGQVLGGYVPLLASGNHFISLNLTSPAGSTPWRFFASYLTAPPLVIPLGTRRSLVQMEWRAIPYPDIPYVALFGGSPDPIFDDEGNLIGGLGTATGGFEINRSGELVSSGVPLWDHNQDT